MWYTFEYGDPGNWQERSTWRSNTRERAEENRDRIRRRYQMRHNLTEAESHKWVTDIQEGDYE